MIGIVFALLYLAYRVFTQGDALEAGFVSSTSFLYYWYWVWGIVIFAFVSIPMLLVTLGGAAVGSRLGSSGLGKMAGALGGATIGGGFSLLILVLTAARLALSIGGAWLLMTAGTPAMTFAQFDMAKLVVGGIMLLVSLLMRSKSSSSSSSSTSTRSVSYRRRSRY